MFCHFNVQLEFIEVNFLTIIHFRSDVVGKNLGLDIVGKTGQTLLYLSIGRQHDLDSVGYFKRALQLGVSEEMQSWIAWYLERMV